MTRSSLLTLAFAVATVQPALALNFCFNPGTTGSFESLAVAERYKKPHAGSCTPINGFDLVRDGAPMVAGTACLNSAGDTLRVAYTVEPYARIGSSGTVDHPPLSVYMTLPYPPGPGGNLSGGFGYARDDAGASDSVYTGAHANPCIPSSPTLP